MNTMTAALISCVMATCLALAGCSGPGEETEDPDAAEGKAVAPPTGVETGLPDAAIAANNRGVGLMGRFEYDSAERVFRELAERHPEWLQVRVNQAIATLNRQEEGDEQRALALVDEVLAEDPEHLRAHYVAGLLRLYLSSPEAALPHFRSVAAADPEDGYAAYYLAQCLAQQGEHEQALNWYQRAMRLDPYLRSAYYGAFQALQRLKRRDQARQLIGDYQRLDANPRARLAEFKYTRMGPKGEAVAVNAPGPEPLQAPRGPLFAASRVLATLGALPAGSAPHSITAADLDGDGLLELFVSGVGNATPPHNLLLRGQPDGGYQSLPAHPLSQVAQVNAALWGDYDNDGLLDVYLCRSGPNQLWRQAAPGEWVDVTLATATANGTFDTRDGAFFDADHDGDLDLFLINADGPDELLNNNLDGSFRPLAEAQGLSGGQRASLAVVPVDLDRDRDLDILVLHAEPPHGVYINDRLWTYHEAKDFDSLREIPLRSALAADLNADGLPELVTADPTGRLLRWEKDARGSFQAGELAPAPRYSSAWFQLGVLDADGDGNLDLLQAGAGGWSVVSAEGSTMFRVDSKDLAGVTPLVRDAGAGPSLLGLSGSDLRLWEPDSGRFRYLTVSLSGLEDQAQSMRSNASGIGARLSVRVGSRWTMRDHLRSLSGPGQSLQPLAFGLGGAKQADFVAIDWSDGVFQSELALGAGQAHRITETQRQLSSCPVLFAWDGQSYHFVTDLLGVGGIGYAVGPGEYSPPRPWENLLLPEGLAQPRDGRYLLKLSEPMEEALYLDSVRLLAYDLPPGWQLVLDERMGIAGPDPTGVPSYYRREVQPVEATNERGEEVAERILAADGWAAPVGKLDRRFVGLLRDEHVLTLEFAQALDAVPGDPLLVADGWVEYPYSQTSFAAWQAGASFDAPTLEARDEAGKWHRLLEGFGYPAGMPRRISLPLPGLPKGTRALRLRSNMQVYWDRVAVAYAETQPRVRISRLPLRSARVAKTGYAMRTTLAQHRPHYDYSRRSPFWDARYLAGNYTRLGPVKELLGETDDALAIIGSGEEIHLEFDAPEAVLPPGWSRRLVLETNGWTKDMDLFTDNGETLEPLPGRRGSTEQAARMNEHYNWRYQSGL